MEDLLLLWQSYSFLGNTIWQYIIALGYFVLALLVLHIFRSVVVLKLQKLAKKTENTFDDAVIACVHGLRARFYIVLSVYLASMHVALTDLGQNILGVVVLLIVVSEVAGVFGCLIDFFIDLYVAKMPKSGREHARSMLRILRGAILLVVWALAFLVILSNLGINVTALIASMGIGGIAIALALQNVLSDIFSSFSIFIDKPFQIGDYIVIGDKDGIVKSIGLKTTRLETLRGEVLVMPNTEITGATIENFRQMRRRRDVITIGITYETGAKKRENVPEIVAGVVGSQEGVEFSRCHLKELGAYSIDFEVVYYINSRDFVEYMNIREAILSGFLVEFTKRGIDFAYPTQRVQLEK